jgi:hypothetical protein
VSVDAPRQVIGRDVVIEAEIMEQPSVCRLNAHHRYLSPNQMRQRITTLPSHQSTADFFNDIGKYRSFPYAFANGEIDPLRVLRSLL